MKDIPADKLADIIRRAHQVKPKELGQVYMLAAIMQEAEATPDEVVAYLEEKFVC